MLMRFIYETCTCHRCGGTGKYRDRAVCANCDGRGTVLTAAGQRAKIRVQHWFGIGQPAGYAFGKGVRVTS